MITRGSDRSKVTFLIILQVWKRRPRTEEFSNSLTSCLFDGQTSFLSRTREHFFRRIIRKAKLYLDKDSFRRKNTYFFLSFIFFFFRKLSYLQAIGFEKNIFERIEGFIFIGEKGVIELFDFDLDTIKMEKRWSNYRDKKVVFLFLIFQQRWDKVKSLSEIELDDDYE